MEPLLVKVRNFRCIPYRSPLEFEIRQGTTFLLGLNNTGKTTLLRLFSELRPMVVSALKSGSSHSSIAGVYGDSILNQTSQESQIELTFSRGSNYIKVIILPDPTRHSSSFRVTTEPGANGIPTKPTAATDEIAADAIRLFQKSMLAPPYRTTIAGMPKMGFQDLFLGTGLVEQLAEWGQGKQVEHRKQTRAVIERLGSIFGFEKFDIRPSNDRQHILVTTDDGEFRLDELGNGISHFVVVLLNVLIHRPDFILADEPELGLHPRMQQEFVRSLAAQANIGLFCASHSIGLARSAADRILHVSRREGGGIQLADFGKRDPTVAQALHELGYSSFVEIGGNNILLVEGQTEIKAYREILRKFGIDQDFILWHLGGGALIKSDAFEELQEVQRLNARNVFVVFDSEREFADAPLKGRFQEFKVLCEKLGFVVFSTDFHSTENYISQSALDAEFGDGKYRALTPYEDFKTVQPRWAKNQNWKLFGRMHRHELENTDLGKFIVARLCACVS